MNDKILMEIEKKCEEIIPQIFEISKYIHDHPEIALQEKLSSECLVSALKKEGFDVSAGIAGLPTAFSAEYDTLCQGPTFAYLAEYDALPEIGHGCGHNLIAASAAGAAMILKKIAPLLKGKIKVFGTPAEESFGGKVQMINKGIFSGIDATVMLHPETVNIVNGSALAVNSLTFKFLGKSAHAASSPHKGINALDAVILTFNNINALRQQVKPDCRIHGIISRGGVAPNIIPEKAEAQFYVRSPLREELDVLVEKVKDCARGAAMATGCTLHIGEEDYPNDNMVNNPVLSKMIEKYMKYFGLQDILQEDPYPGSTDFGNVSYVIPSAYGFVATAGSDIEIHSLEFAKSQVGPEAKKGLITMTKILAAVGAEFLSDADVADQVKKTFAAGK